MMMPSVLYILLHGGQGFFGSWLHRVESYETFVNNFKNIQVRTFKKKQRVLEVVRFDSLGRIACMEPGE